MQIRYQHHPSFIVSFPHIASWADLDADLHYSHPSTENDDWLEVIWIPGKCKPTDPIFRTQLSLFEVLPTRDNPTELEKRLGRIPNTDSYTCGWASRSLVKVEFSRKDLIDLELSIKDLGDFDREWQADHMMYVCLEEEPGLPHNRFLEQIAGVEVFGDAFVFKMESKAFEDSGRVVYVDMEENFVQDAKSESGRLAKRVLRKLMQTALKEKEKQFDPHIVC